MTARAEGEGCVRFPELRSLSSRLPEATYPVTLSVATDDGRLSAEYPAQLSARPDAAGALSFVESRVRLSLAVGQVGTTGFTALGDVSQYEALALSLLSEVNGEAVLGEIVLNGLKTAPCATQPPPTTASGTPACEGTNFTLLQRGSWQAAAAP